ncbi:MAG: hypothetical protein QOF21_1578 [Actinomycetota bacterium]|jgi:hypothetical protein
MKLRGLLTGALALALLGGGSVATTARADEAPIDADVGGGVAGIVAEVEIGSTLFHDTLDKDYVTVSLVTPRAQLPASGGSFTKGAANKTVGPVKVKALWEAISGSRSGVPAFATGQSILTGVEIGATKIRALDVTCTWDLTGPRGATTITEVNGTQNNPAPNQPPTEIPGLGTLQFNEQFIEGHYIYHRELDDGTTWPYVWQETIFVYGAHLILNADASDHYGVVDVILGFTSCDPTRLPPLSGIKLGSNVS